MFNQGGVQRYQFAYSLTHLLGGEEFVPQAVTVVELAAEAIQLTHHV